MAKPPSGVNSGTAVPVAKPKAPKVGGMPGAPMGKAALPAQAQQHMAIAGSKAATPGAGAAPAKMPSQGQQAGRAAGFGAALAGAFQPKGPINSGLELAPKKPAGLSAPGAGAQRSALGSGPVAKPGFGKSEPSPDTLKKADLGNCPFCQHPEHVGDCQP